MLEGFGEEEDKGRRTVIFLMQGLSVKGFGGGDLFCFFGRVSC